MPPKKKFTPFDPGAYSKPFVPLAGYEGYQGFQPGAQGQYGQYNQYNQYNYNQAQFNQGYQADSATTSGTSTPISANASSLSLSSLSSALKDVESTPVTEHFEAILAAQSSSDMHAAAEKVADALAEAGAQAIEKFYVHENIGALIKAKNSALAREGAAYTLSTIARKFADDPIAGAYLLASYTVPFDLLSDKVPSVKRAAQSCTEKLYSYYSDEAKATVVLSKLLDYLNSSAKWQAKLGALKNVERLLEDLQVDFIEPRFVDALPILTNVMHDMKPELSKAATKTITELANRLDNQDVVPRIPVIIKTLNDPRNVQECIKTLSQVTFVAEVTEPALALLVPILNRALNQTSTSQDALRQTVIVVENLTRLVHNPREVKAFIPQLLPGVQKVVSTAAQPEVRELASKALKVLEDAEKEDEHKTRVTQDEVKADLAVDDKLDFTLAQYVVPIVELDINTREFAKLEANLKAFFSMSDEDASAQVGKYKSMFADSAQKDSDEEGIEIVNADFSLAYGGRMLLNKTTLRLFKGRRYGLCGRNGAGKSTLMRSIANGKLEGFPDKSELRTCFVEHKLQGSEADMDIVSFIASDPELCDVGRDAISEALKEVGFDDDRQKQNVGALSGGWKMKLELARAVLMKADILLLDEPTNHLDVANVKWLEDYLITHTDITSLIVSHDSGFLDTVCTDIIHYEQKKLVYYKGNLSDFVKVRPEGKSYYTLTDSNVKMAFPPPGILTGVKSATRAIARMTDVSFTYEGAPKPSLEHVSCSLSLSSRVAILGPNGAGKSTLIKLLTGELIPSSGSVEKHPNLRIGYIAQHALKHVEEHKEKTPNQYLQWRYQHGDDREVHLKQTRKWTAEEKAQMAKPIDLGDGKGPRVVEAIIGRQKLKKTFQYEIKWKGWLPKFNSHLPRDFLLEQGFLKAVQAFDDHESSREGLGYRELSPPVIRKHFEDVGLDGEIADHTPMGSLSGGQLVKVVIAGAMWNNPHLLVLDEPTNYLDRDSLGGLAVAIRDWTGGVIMISHNEEFVGALCPEQWHVKDGKVVQKGKAAVSGDRFEDSSGAPSSTTSAAASDADDSPANIKVRRKKKKLTRNELKEREVRRRLRYLEWLNTPKGTPRPPDTDDEEE
uniref:ARAD1D24552p n=1 Tax=Blastobotrys adeninivorans TaxID=409370 RepID=A0A060TFN6_BLAAD